MGGIPDASAPTRQDWSDLVEREWDDLVLELCELVLFHVRHNSGLKPLVRSRIIDGEKFGPLDLAKLDFSVMTAEEIADAIAYLAGERLHERTKGQ